MYNKASVSFRQSENTHILYLQLPHLSLPLLQLSRLVGIHLQLTLHRQTVRQKVRLTQRCVLFIQKLGTLLCQLPNMYTRRNQTCHDGQVAFCFPVTLAGNWRNLESAYNHNKIRNKTNIWYRYEYQPLTKNSKS